MIPAALLAISLYFFSGDSTRIIIFWAAIDPSAWTVVTSWKADSWEHTIRWAVDHFQAVLGAVLGRAAEVVFQVVVDIRVLPVLPVRRRGDDPAADVLDQS